MAEYDLSVSLNPHWDRIRRGLRIGLGAMVVAAIAWGGYRGYLGLSGRGLNLLGIVGFAVALAFLGFILVLVIEMSPPATRLVIDDGGVRMDYVRGREFSRSWTDAGIAIRGRRTDGVGDSVSGGQPRWSIYGRFGGLSETFILKETFDELVHQARAHGLELNEQRGNPGWLLYAIQRPRPTSW